MTFKLKKNKNHSMKLDKDSGWLVVFRNDQPRWFLEFAQKTAEFVQNLQNEKNVSQKWPFLGILSKTVF